MKSILGARFQPYQTRWLTGGSLRVALQQLSDWLEGDTHKHEGYGMLLDNSASPRLERIVRRRRPANGVL
jgi:hypothetical protein